MKANSVFRGRLQPRRTEAWIILAAIGCGIVSYAVRFPGVMGPDATNQYRQALTHNFTDWHPPIMAAVWSVLTNFGSGSAPMLALQVLLYWIGVGFVASGLCRIGRTGAALFLVLASASPLFIYYNGMIYKDVAVSSALAAAFGIAFWWRVQQRRLPVAAGAICGLLIAYGTLARANAVFAFAPVALFIFWPSLRGLRMAGLALLLTCGAIPTSSFINHQILGARESGVDVSLPLYDLVGIAHYSGDMSVLPSGVSMSEDQLTRCYSPRFWDPLGEPVCGNPLGQVVELRPKLSESVYVSWLRAIARHPVAYAEHRVKHFNASLNWVVPALACRWALFDIQCGSRNELGQSIDTPETRRWVKIDYLKKNFLVWPATWVGFGLTLFFLIVRESAGPEVVAARYLLASGLIYGSAYLLVGIAADIRYYYWTMVAVQVAAVLSFRSLKQSHKVRYLLGVVAAVAAVGYVARFTEATYFVT